MIAQIFLPLLLVTSALAAPLDRKDTQACTVPATALNLQPPFTQLYSPPRSVVVGFGVQNYTCDSSGKYASAGAIAGLIDIACLYGTPEFAESQDNVYNVWEEYKGLDTWGLIYEFLDDFKIPLVGTHYFINYEDTILPKFDFTSYGPTAGNPDAFVVGTRVAGIPAPYTERDIDWVELNAVSGKYADKVYRVETRGGQPPASCTPGSDPISIKYATQYWFEGGSI